MHAATAGRGDLNNDTVTIVGGALDLQEKVVKQAMTPIDNVFMISIDSKLGYETLQQIVSSGHSRIPVYQEIEIPVNRARGGSGTLTPIRGGFLSALMVAGVSRAPQLGITPPCAFQIWSWMASRPPP